jgi:hypothetical protein
MASVSGPEGMAERKRRHPQRGVAARLWVHTLSLSLEYGQGRCPGEGGGGGSPEGGGGQRRWGGGLVGHRLEGCSST